MPERTGTDHAVGGEDAADIEGDALQLVPKSRLVQRAYRTGDEAGRDEDDEDAGPAKEQPQIGAGRRHNTAPRRKRSSAGKTQKCTERGAIAHFLLEGGEQEEH